MTNFRQFTLLVLLQTQTSYRGLAMLNCTMCHPMMVHDVLMSYWTASNILLCTISVRKFSIHLALITTSPLRYSASSMRNVTTKFGHQSSVPPMGRLQSVSPCIVYLWIFKPNPGDSLDSQFTTLETESYPVTSYEFYRSSSKRRTYPADGKISGSKDGSESEYSSAVEINLEEINDATTRRGEGSQGNSCKPAAVILEMPSGWKNCKWPNSSSSENVCTVQEVYFDSLCVNSDP